MHSIIPIRSLLYLSQSAVINIIRDIVVSHPSDPELITIKDNLCKALLSITNKKHFFFDTDIDKTVKHIMGDIGVFKERGHLLLDSIEQWVASPHTYWDKEQLESIIGSFRALILSSNGQTLPDKEHELVVFEQGFYY